jgi:hypothetical protein
MSDLTDRPATVAGGLLLGLRAGNGRSRCTPAAPAVVDRTRIVAGAPGHVRVFSCPPLVHQPAIRQRIAPSRASYQEQVHGIGGARVDRWEEQLARIPDNVV